MEQKLRFHMPNSLRCSKDSSWKMRIRRLSKIYSGGGIGMSFLSKQCLGKVERTMMDLTVEWMRQKPPLIQMSILAMGN